MKDISTRSDIKFLLDEFYQRLTQDELIGHFFTKVIPLDMGKHMPIMYDFWETILLENITYRDNAMLKHIKLNEKEPLKTEHFERWLMHWENCLNENFSGDKATEALKRARQIASVMQHKTEQENAKR